MTGFGGSSRIEHDHVEEFGSKTYNRFNGGSAEIAILMHRLEGFRVCSPKLQIGVAAPRKRLDSETPR